MDMPSFKGEILRLYKDDVLVLRSEDISADEFCAASKEVQDLFPNNKVIWMGENVYAQKISIIGDDNE